MAHLFRDTAFGGLIRWASRRRFFVYPEDRADFQCPTSYNPAAPSSTSLPAADSQPTEKPRDEAMETAGDKGAADSGDRASATLSAPSTEDLSLSDGDETDDREKLSQVMSRPQMSHITTRATLAQAYADATRQEQVRQMHTVIKPKTVNGITLVDWYHTDDPENPQNWSTRRKTLVVLQIYVYTLAVYIGSAIITPSQPYIEAEFNLQPEVASLGLSMYVLGYGVGPLGFLPAVRDSSHWP